MEWRDANNIFNQIKNASGDNNQDLAELYNDLLRSALLYARVRADWKLANKEERIQMDARRSALHNAFIDSCNILARYMAGRGMDTSWRSLLGNERREIGDFACYVHCFLGIAAK